MNGLILAAGLGTRLKPWTDHHPKALVPVGSCTMLERVIVNMIRADIHTIVINVHSHADQIIDFVEQNRHRFNARLIISDETNLLLDTGGAIVKADFLLPGHDDILIHNADIYTDFNLSELIEFHRQFHSDATLLTSHRDSTRQLIVNGVQLSGWINHKTGETIPREIARPHAIDLVSFNGIHIISRRLVRYLESLHPLNEPFPIIPEYVLSSKQFKIMTQTPHYDYTWVDIGKPDNLVRARQIDTIQSRSKKNNEGDIV